MSEDYLVSSTPQGGKTFEKPVERAPETLQALRDKWNRLNPGGKPTNNWMDLLDSIIRHLESSSPAAKTVAPSENKSESGEASEGDSPQESAAQEK